MLYFTDYFWGEKNNGFDVLYHNMKHGQLSSKEFSDFLRESCSVEESYAKLLGRLAKFASNCSSNGSFSPVWQALRAVAEKLSSLHQQLVLSWQDLIKDVHRYTEEQHKKHKNVKDSESSTLETVQSIQQTTAALHKAKETYHARFIELEKLKRENVTGKDLEKAEGKCKKAHDEYKGLVEKYTITREEFEKKMTESCKKFQEVEEHHLQQMKDFVDTYARAWEHQYALLGRVHEEFRANTADLTVDKLIETMVQAKTTGTEKPGPIEFEEADVSALPAPAASTESLEKKEGTPTEKPRQEGASPSGSPDLSGKAGLLERTYVTRASTRWFLSKTKKEKKKEKKKKKKDKDKDQNSAQTTPQVDEEGFSIRPEHPMENHEDRNSWYSSSDSDSDVEEKRKIKVEIKPFSPNGTAPVGNVDDIRKSIEGLRLSPTSTRRQPPQSASDPNMKRSISVSETMNSGKPSQDLLGLDLFGTSSSASTPTGGNYSFPSPQQQSSANVSTDTSAATTPVSSRDTNEMFNLGSPANTPPSLPAKVRPGAGTPTGAPLLPGPPPVRATARPKLTSQIPFQAKARPSGRQSPAPMKMDRADSAGSMNSVTFNTTSMPVGSSRGPSPLTIGMSDTIPLAVAFSETINAYFKGADDSNCKAKLTGDLMVSFPAGIVRVLMENPNPAMLSFRLKNSSRIEQILVNKQLVTQESSDSENCIYTFEMSALTEHLKRQADTNKTASYFNVDILKYQVKMEAGKTGAPLHLLSYWKCEPSQTDFRLDYSYNGAAVMSRTPLTNVSVLVPVDGDVTHLQAKPTAIWSADTKRALWKLGDISEMNEEGGQGCIRAKFDLNDGPSNPSPVAVQFVGEGNTMSGVDFELAGTGYRLSLTKKRFTTGKYIVDADNTIRYV